MKSFPTTLNESEAMYSSGKYKKYRYTFDVERIKAINLNTSLPVIERQLDQNVINAGNFQAYPSMTQLFYNSFNEANEDSATYYEDDSHVFYENPLQMPAQAIALAKDYDWIYKYKVNAVASEQKDGESLSINITSSDIVPSMFNPMYGVSAMGLMRNTPLLNDFEPDEYDKNIDDCSIRTLCALSKDPNSPIGAHRFKYADFMYCKDLGKVSNNHLITLRKFVHPVPDHIGRGTTPRHLLGKEDWQWEIEGDVGRLVTWFGTDDNKLENIAKFSYHATWKEFNAEIEQMYSKADSSNTGIIGMISNSFNPEYNKRVGEGHAGDHSILTWLGSKVTSKVTQGIGSNNFLLKNYDNYKIYTPKNTIQSNHQYEGKLVFSHEFSLTFSYELRAYDNINPRSAFLDLIGNILEVTYRRGKFWGGDRKIIGPAQDSSMFNKVNRFIDGTIDKIPGFFASFAMGGANLSKLMGTLGAGATELFGQVVDSAKGAFGSIKNGALASYFSKLNKEANWTEAVKGMVKNALGRPQLYAWHSLVKGDDVGLWHVTVGNPKNPILSIGNLILENAELQQYGPLGVDDFPTQLKVIVTLKHPRPRDITDIGRMYTGGTNALYHVLARHKVADFFGENPGTPVVGTDVDEVINVPEKQGKEQKAPEATPSSKEAQSAELAELEKQRKLDNQKYGEGIKPFIPTTLNGLPDPSIYTADDIKMMRMNTWSETVFSVMMQEAA